MTSEWLLGKYLLEAKRSWAPEEKLEIPIASGRFGNWQATKPNRA
jgi:hypothetical protein